MQWPKTKAAAIKMAPAGNDQEALKALAAMARPLEAASLVKMRQKRAAEQRAEEPPPKNAKLAPPASWFGNHEQNDDAEQNGESEQNADIFAAPRILFQANAAGTSNASQAETNQPAPAGAAERKPQEACNK